MHEQNLNQAKIGDTMTTLTLDLDQQVALLMQGTEYGDEQLKAAMARELRERLEGRPPAARLLRL